MCFIVCTFDNLEYLLLVFKAVGVLAVRVFYNRGRAFTVSVSLLHTKHLIWRSFSVCWQVSVLRGVEGLRRFTVANLLSFYAIYLDNYTFTLKEFTLLALFWKSTWILYTERSFRSCFCSGDVTTCSFYFIATPQLQEERWPEANQESWV